MKVTATWEETLELLPEDGEELKFSGFPLNIFYSPLTKDYYIKCKGVYISYTRFIAYEDGRNNEVGFNKDGDPCKVKNKNNTTSIGCLTDETSTFIKLVKQIKLKVKKWHYQKQAQERVNKKK